MLPPPAWLWAPLTASRRCNQWYKTPYYYLLDSRSLLYQPGPLGQRNALVTTLVDGVASSDVAKAAHARGRSTRLLRRACRACSVDPGGLKTPVEHAGRPSGGQAGLIANLGTGWRRREPSATGFTAGWPGALLGFRSDSGHDQGCFRDRLEHLNTAEQRVVRICAVADRAPPVALSATRRAPGGDAARGRSARWLRRVGLAPESESRAQTASRRPSGRAGGLRNC